MTDMTAICKTRAEIAEAEVTRLMAALRYAESCASAHKTRPQRLARGCREPKDPPVYTARREAASHRH